MHIADVRLDVERRMVTRHGEPVHLTPTEYELFKLLALQAGRVLTYRALRNRVWGEQYEAEVHYPRTVMTSLREKSGRQVIQTEPGVGYRLAQPL